MEAGELARQKASALHDAGVLRGDDPTRLYLFAKSQANHCDIDVETCQQGASILDGGRAKLIAARLMILHENSGSEFDQAFLIAHELGHAVLGDGTGHVAFDNIDPARPAEPSPVGIDRVVDYGRRQRREIQMDLFARELLLPRSLVRRLHVDENLSATAIAQRFQAPFDVVAQQLLDALLLPAVEARAEEAKPPPALNTLQDDAAKHRGGPYLLEAGPGTGKTQTLTARIEGLLAGGVDPRRILVLTFSNKAAGELSERIGRKDAAAAAAMWIGTFHAFGLDLVRRFHGELGLPKDPRMMDRTEAVEFFEKHFPKLRLRHHHNIQDPTGDISDLLAAVSRAKDEVVSAEEYVRLAQAMGDAPQADAEAEEAAERVIEIGKFYSAYETMKHAAACIDFGDLVSLPVRLLEGNPFIRETLAGTYEHVLVDEYQDVNRASIRLIQALCPGGKNLWAVGDAKQSIYRFRGASSFNVARFGAGDFDGGTRGQLGINYRSRREIVETFSAFARNMQVGSVSTTLQADRAPCGHLPELRVVKEKDQQSVAIADAIEEMRREGYAYRDQAILCSGNGGLAQVGRDLEALGIPVLFLGSLFDRPEVKDLLSFLLLLADKLPIGLLRVGNLDAFRLTLTEVSAIVDHVREHGDEDWLEHREALPVADQASKASLAALAEALAGFDEKSKPWEVLAKLLLDRTRMTATLAASEKVTERSGGIAIWQFMNFVRSQPASEGLPVRRLLDRIKRLARIGDDRDLRRAPAAAMSLDAVKLMTIHGAKGLEFPIVHVPGLNQDVFPGAITGKSQLLPPNGMIFGATGNALEASRQGETEERECLFYVAASRAQERLLLYAVSQKKGGAARPRSPYLDVLGTTLKRGEVTPTRLLPAPATSTALNVISAGPTPLTVAQVTLYKKCARRFFYTHVIRIGGHRVETGYMRMHEAVRAVVQDVVKSGSVSDVDDKELTQAITEAFRREELEDPDAIVELHDAALRMLRYFCATRRSHTAVSPAVLTIQIGDQELTFQPDDVLVAPTGERIFRVIKTGHKLDVKKDLGAGAHLVMVRGTDMTAVVEMVFLADGVTEKLDFSKTVVKNRHTSLTEILAGIRAGAFPTTDEQPDRVCPNCPAFFICGPVPLGRLERKS